MVSPREGYSDGLLGPRFPCPCRFHRAARSEEHTSELQSRSDLVCRLLLEKKKKVRLLQLSAAVHRSGFPSTQEMSCAGDSHNKKMLDVTPLTRPPGIATRRACLPLRPRA